MAFRDYVSEAKALFDKLLPDNQITEIDYEGPTIVVYTKNIDLFSRRDDIARQIAQELRRRVMIRPDPSIMEPEKEAEETIRNIVPPRPGYRTSTSSLTRER